MQSLSPRRPGPGDARRRGARALAIERGPRSASLALRRSCPSASRSNRGREPPARDARRARTRPRTIGHDRHLRDPVRVAPRRRARPGGAAHRRVARARRCGHAAVRGRPVRSRHLLDCPHAPRGGGCRARRIRRVLRPDGAGVFLRPGSVPLAVGDRARSVRLRVEPLGVPGSVPDRVEGVARHEPVGGDRGRDSAPPGRGCTGRAGPGDALRGRRPEAWNPGVEGRRGRHVDAARELEATSGGAPARSRHERPDDDGSSHGRRPLTQLPDYGYSN